jgi:hypothetical protein
MAQAFVNLEAQAEAGKLPHAECAIEDVDYCTFPVPSWSQSVGTSGRDELEWMVTIVATHIRALQTRPKRGDRGLT